MFVEINGLAYNLMFTQSIDKLDEDGKYKILYAISNENKLVEEFDNEADRDAKYEKAQAAGGASKEEIEHIEDEIEHLKEVGFHPLKVDELPTEDIKDYILYLVPSDIPGEDNLCYEYLYINNAWEMVGTTSVDLSNYYTKDEVDDRSIFNIALPNSTFEGNFGNMDQRDYQAFLPLLQFIYTKCRGTNRITRLPFVNIYTAHDAPSWLDSDNSQLFVVSESYNMSDGLLHITLNGIPKFNNSGVAKYFSLHISGVIENDNITSIRTVTLNKSILPVASKSYVDNALANIDLSKVVGFINLKNYSSSNPLVLSTLEPGAYIVSNDAWPGASFPMVARPGGRSTTIFDFSLGRFACLFIENKIPEVYDNVRRSVYLSLRDPDKVGVYIITDDGYSLSPQWNLFKELLTTNTSQTISGTKTFSVIPQQSNTTAPTQDTQFTNKKYVDDSIAGASSGAGYTYLYVDCSNVTLNNTFSGDAQYIAYDLPTDVKNKIVSEYNALVDASVNINNIVIVCQNLPKWESKSFTFYGGTLELYSNLVSDTNYSNRMYYFVSRPITNTMTNVWKNELQPTYMQYQLSLYAYDSHEDHKADYVDMLHGWLFDNNAIFMTPETGDTKYLNKNNTSSYTPTADYHPATKKYVDDNLYTPDAIDYTFDVNTTGYYLNDATKTITNETALENLKSILNSIIAGGEVHQKQDTITIINSATQCGRVYTCRPYYNGGMYHAITDSSSRITIDYVCVMFPENTTVDDTMFTRVILRMDVSFNGGKTEITNIHSCKILWNYATYAITDNVLTKTNTSSFTPTADYNPATKKYVDDVVAGVSPIVGVTHSRLGTDATNSWWVHTYQVNKEITDATMGSLSNLIKDVFNDCLPHMKDINLTHLLRIHTINEVLIEWKFGDTTSWKPAGNNTRFINVFFFDKNFIGKKVISATANYTSDGAIESWYSFTLYDTTLSALSTNNTVSYTPTNSYHPATKKYVDDAIAAAITDALGGSY